MSLPTISSPNSSSSSLSSSKIPVWLDCDPGHDDACAILLSGFSSRCRLLGISTVAGNVSLEKTTDNALKVLYLAGLSYLPVVPGSAKPLLRPSRACPEIHGDSGLDSFETINWSTIMTTSDQNNTNHPNLPNRKAVNSKAVNYIAAAIKGALQQHKEKVTIIATGCLTNIALLLTIYPEIIDDIKQIVIMGGAVGRNVSGNTKPNAEFNFEIDPEAAAIVFQSGVEITLVPLDVTHKVLVTPAVMDAIAHGGTVNSKENNPTDASVGAVTPFRKIMVSLLQYFTKSYHDTFQMTYPPLHDPVAVLAAIDPSLFTITRRYVTIETVSPICAGCSIVDWHGLLKKTPNTNVCLDVDVSAFWRFMLEAIAQADAHSPINTVDDIKVAKGILGNLLTPGIPFPTLNVTSPLKGIPITSTTILSPSTNRDNDVPVTPVKADISNSSTVTAESIPEANTASVSTESQPTTELVSAVTTTEGSIEQGAETKSSTSDSTGTSTDAPVQHAEPTSEAAVTTEAVTESSKTETSAVEVVATENSSTASVTTETSISVVAETSASSETVETTTAVVETTTTTAVETTTTISTETTSNTTEESTASS